MIPQIPIALSVIFGLITLAALLLFNKAVRKSPLESTRKKAGPILAGSLLWIILQGVLAKNDVFTSSLDSMPPKLFLFGFIPAFSLFIILFATKAGRTFIDSLPLKELVYVNMVRVPVELVLFALYLYHAVPRLMTFEGGNLDILSGLSAPLIVYFAFRKDKVNSKLLLIWNILCLGLLLNIVSRALLSLPVPFQKLAFDQPNIAILIFPFIWLPTFVVMTVLFGHLVSLRKLILKIE